MFTYFKKNKNLYKSRNYKNMWESSCRSVGLRSKKKLGWGTWNCSSTFLHPVCLRQENYSSAASEKVVADIHVHVCVIVNSSKTVSYCPSAPSMHWPWVKSCSESIFGLSWRYSTPNVDLSNYKWRRISTEIYTQIRVTWITWRELISKPLSNTYIFFSY